MEHQIASKLGWKLNIDYPEWGNNEMYLKTIKAYVNGSETPQQMYHRLASTASKKYGDKFYNEFYKILWNGWLIPSTPVAVNLGTEKGLPISCYSGRIGDSMFEIGRKNLEFMMLSKMGGGTAYDFSNIRATGAPIKNGLLGQSNGVVPFMKVMDSAVLASKQGSTRRGAVALYLDTYHGDFEDFLMIRRPKGDVNRQCLNVNTGAVISDKFMQNLTNGGDYEQRVWRKIMVERVEAGEPYMFFIDNANKNLPENWKRFGLKVWHSNLCTEIMLPTDENHTFVCCLSSVNLFKYREFEKAKECPFYYGTLFLDAVIEEFIEKARTIQGIEDAVRFAEKSRALGLGTLGWHSLLQSEMIPFDGLQAQMLTKIIFNKMKKQSDEASKYIASEYGQPEWCKGTPFANLTKLAVAPNVSSSKLAGGISQSIEPIAGNAYVDDDSKSTFIKTNPILEKLLESSNNNTQMVWDSIFENKGSVSHLKFLSNEEKQVFKTFKEINQMEIVKQAIIRQKYLDQGQSVNLRFPQKVDAKYVSAVHYAAWAGGLKSLYYYRSESNLTADSANKNNYQMNESPIENIPSSNQYGCVSCEG